MADFKLRLPDPLAARFDAWAADRGGRSPALRALIETACAQGAAGDVARLGPRPEKLTVRLGAADALGLREAASAFGLTPNAWAAALVRRRLTGRPTFGRAGEVALVAIQSELRRIGVNVNQIARALNTAVLEGRELELELDQLAAFRRELRAHLAAVREAFEGNLADWEVDG